MGMVSFWVPVSEIESAGLLRGRVDAWDLLEDERCVDVDKAWHAIHVALTGGVDEVDTPLGLVVLGGTTFGEDGGYGPPRLLTPEQVRVASEALDELGPGGFAEHLDIAELARLQAYPSVWDEADDDELRSWLGDGFDLLAATFRRATADGSAMLIMLT
ncbi:MAG TPA: YfbM family protein [Acidimicrobiales bacterium]|nr:YfbM family protein [Acidimicrobiales bacterium]